MFIEAKPVWIDRKETQVNYFAGFVCNFSFELESQKSVVLRLAGQSEYSVYLNGDFVHSGPARAGNGYSRVDEIDLASYLHNGINSLYVEVAGYNCGCMSLIDGISFVCAEVLCDEKVIAYTCDDDINNSTYKGISEFAGFELASKERKVIRYSFQRPFTEVYHFNNNGCDDNNPAGRVFIPATITSANPKVEFLPRGVSYPNYDFIPVSYLVEKGRLSERNPDNIPSFHEIMNFKPETNKGFVEFDPEEYESHAVLEYLKYDFIPVRKLINRHTLLVDNGEGFNDIDIKSCEYRMFSLAHNTVGFISMGVIADEDSDVYICFDEKLLDGAIRIEGLGTNNIIKLSLKKSDKEYFIQSFEPYGMKYMTVFVTRGSISINELGVVEYANSEDSNTKFHCSDHKLNEIFEAARQTYRTNSVDVFMDCPTRERAGWLCDSCFTAQSAQFFSGNSKVERNFLENYVFGKPDTNLPENMLAMAYPAIHSDGTFIPQWAMWYIIELKGYLKRDAESDLERYRALCYNLLEYFSDFKNTDGLLENLDSWNFIEWSKANDWVKDVNYPTNMLYSKVLRIIGELYGDRELIDESRTLKEKIIEQSFNGDFFVDNAVRSESGELVLTGNISEVCQYYAFYFDVAHKGDSRFDKLVDTVLKVFGPEREKSNELKHIELSNAFPGYQMRLAILMKWKEYETAIDTIKGYFYRMADMTGTLWENKKIEGSLNHGFASFVGAAIIMCLTGLNEINEKYHFVSADTSNVKGITYDISINISDGEIKCYKKQGYHGYIDIPESYLLIADR